MNQKILIIEDDVLFAHCLSDMLIHKDYHDVEIVDNGSDAEEYVKTNLPDLIIADINIRGKYDGIETVKKIQGEYDIPVIYLTAYSDENVIERAKLTHPFAYVIKPVDNKYLYTTVELVLFRHTVERELKENRKKLKQLVDKKTESLTRINKQLVKEINERKNIEENLKLSETRFRNLVDHNVDAIIIIGHDGLVKFVNPAAEKLFSKKAEKFIGYDFGFPIVSGETTEIGIVNKESKNIYAEMRVVNTNWEGKDALLASIRDITDRKVSEQKLESERNRAQFFKELLLHDINNYNHGIFSYLWMYLKKSQEGEKDENKLEKCLNLSGKITELIDNVMISSGLREEESDIKTVNISEVVKDCVPGLIKNNGFDKKIKIQHDFDDDVFVKANNLIDTLFNNIISNAIKYNESDTVRIDISHSFIRNDTYCQIEFKDNGIGVPNKDKETIFNRLERVNQDNTVDGFGLGLTIVKNVIEGWGGKIWVKDRIKGDSSKGANFIITIPLEKK